MARGEEEEEEGEGAGIASFVAVQQVQLRSSLASGV